MEHLGIASMMFLDGHPTCLYIIYYIYTLYMCYMCLSLCRELFSITCNMIANYLLLVMVKVDTYSKA